MTSRPLLFLQDRSSTTTVVLAGNPEATPEVPTLWSKRIENRLARPILGRRGGGRGEEIVALVKR